MTDCTYPQNTPLNAYRKGCRCDRCKTVKSAADKRRVRTPKVPCPKCGGLKWMENGLCATCAKRPVIDRVVEKVRIDATTGCWIFTGNRNAFGYGIISFKGGGRVAHRVTYEHFVGLVPDGLQLDHLCCVPACCNPDHLEPVTPTENVRRARRPFTHCVNGHPYDDPEPGPTRYCRVCRRASGRRRSARYAAKKREATA